MIIDKLIEEYFESSIGQNVISKLKRAHCNAPLHFHGLTETAKGFFLTSLLTLVKRPALFLANDINSALNLYLEITSLTKLPVFYFPSQEVSVYDQISSDAEVISHQTNTVLHLLNKKEPCLIISTARCLLEKIWNKEELTNTNYVFEININSELEFTDITNKLILIGYKRTPTVTNRGEFSIRGNIFDIYPVVGMPARIELVGDEIESIRSFSTTTQRSLEDLNTITISPRFYVVNPEGEKLLSKISELSKKDNTLQELTKTEISQFKTNSYPENIEYYAQLLTQKQSSLFDYLQENTLIIVDDWEANAIGLKNWHQRNIEIKNELEKNKKIIPLPDFLLHETELILKSLKRHSTAYIERFEICDTTEDISKKSSIDLQFKPSLYFHNQFDKFANTIKDWLSLNHKVIIFTEQPQRIKGLLKEWEIPGISLENHSENNITKNQILISKEGTACGFNMSFANIIVLTDTEIFGTKRRPNLLKKESKPDKYEYYVNLEDLKPNDYVVHIKHGIGKYRGLVKISVDNNEREYLMIEYAADGKLYLPVEQINLLYRYRGSADVLPKLSKLGGSDWELTKKKVKKAIKRIAEDLLNLYTARSKLEGFKFNPDSHWQIEMEEAFPYTETPDQWKAICEVKKDMENSKPMDRLICGDVGYGKTEVALRSIFKSVLSGKQAAVLVPTTILAEQHFNVINDRLAPYPVKIGLLSRFVSHKEQKNIIAKLSLGEIDIVIGTHRLLQGDVNFKDLGLVVIDEEQRFGVVHKEKLKQLRVSVDVITLSATPIPRTLHMALSGARDMSLINTPPANRLPIKTFVGEFKSSILKTSILHELERGGQVYFVHNRVETIYKTASYLNELIPEAKIAIAHGKMQDKELESVMLDFLLKKYNILVCTTIIESGIDISNVNTIIIDNADQMGLAQLYQLRGRVGRREVQAYAYCFYPQDKVLTDTAKNRLLAIKEFSALGSGYQIALRDMEIRGVGNILGPEQHGHMISVGFDLYCHLLNEAVDKLRGLQVQDIELDTVVDLNISAFIPNTYIEDETQKVIEYKRLANLRTKRELDYIISGWKDRFGHFPEEVENLIAIVELRILASHLGIKLLKSEPGIQPEAKNIRIDINFRLDRWLGVQKKLSSRFAERISYKSISRSGTDSSFLLVKAAGLNPKEQLNLLFELINSLKPLILNEKIA